MKESPKYESDRELPINDLKIGPGVSQREVDRWKAAARRFDIIGPERIDIYTFPRPQETKNFFAGETEYDFRDGKLNPINNPLRLIRPATLHSVTSFFYENGQPYG
jgi:hypothetical protein